MKPTFLILKPVNREYLSYYYKYLDIILFHDKRQKDNQDK